MKTLFKNGSVINVFTDSVEKMSTQGLIDVNKFQRVDLVVGE